MRVRADIAAMLRADKPHIEIMRTLHVGHDIVIDTRKAIGLPPVPRGGRPLLPIPDLFNARTEPVAGGHLRWTGHFDDASPVLGRQGRHLSAYRIAFRIRHSREPVGRARPGCGYPQCVAPEHIEDRPMRDQLNAQFAAIFGGTR